MEKLTLLLIRMGLTPDLRHHMDHHHGPLDPALPAAGEARVARRKVARRAGPTAGRQLPGLLDGRTGVVKPVARRRVRPGRRRRGYVGGANGGTCGRPTSRCSDGRYCTAMSYVRFEYYGLL